MTKLAVVVHRLTGDPDGPVLPVLDIQDWFQAHGIDVTFSDGVDFGMYGGDLSADGGEPFSFDSYVVAMQRTVPESERVAGRPAHLYLGRGLEASGVLGSLLHQRHGAASVFKQSIVQRFPGEPEAAMLQVCVHELGHTLACTHRKGKGRHATAMCQADDRKPSASIPEAWALQHAHQPLGVMAFPLEEAQAEAIAGAPAELAPWSGAFPGFGSGAEDDRLPRRRVLELKLRSERGPRLALGDCVGLEIRLTHHGQRAVRVPRRLRPEHQSLRIEIRPPDEPSGYVHVPRLAVCDERTRLLHPGESVYEYVLLADGPRYSVLPVQGRYQIRASIPGLGVESDPLVLEVAEESILGPYDPTLSRWVAKGARTWRGPEGERMTRMLAGARGTEECPLFLWHARRLRQRARWREGGRAPTRPSPLTASGSRAVAYASLLDEARQELSRSASPERALRRAHEIPSGGAKAALLFESLEDMERCARSAREGRRP